MPRSVLDVWAHIDPSFGGVGPAAGSLSAAIGQPQFSVRQVAVCTAAETRLADGIPASVERIVPSGPRPVADFRLRRSLRRLVESSDICHVHGIWLPHAIAARCIAAKAGIPVVSSAHGMLEAWDLKNKAYKKRTYSWLFERRSLARSACLRALSERELGDYRRFGLSGPVAIVPNGIGAIDRADPRGFFSMHPELEGKRIVLFLSRIHVKKGVMNLIEAWQTVTRQIPDAHLVIAGPDCEGDEDRAKAMVARKSLSRSVTFAGVITGAAKVEAFSAAHCFCLPSYSEGLSVAVLEALAIGVPAVVTPECNVGGIAEGAAGYVTSNEPGTLAEALAECLSLEPGEWTAMSNRARELARNRYNWLAIGAQMRSVYEWVLGGPRPDCVVL